MALKIAGNDSFKMKDIADLQQLDTLPSSANVIVEHGGFAKRFDASKLEGKVKTVNGIEPDENGNIKIEVSNASSSSENIFTISVTILKNDNGGYDISADKTFEEIISAVEHGAIAQIVDSFQNVCYLTYAGSDGIRFINLDFPFGLEELPMVLGWSITPNNEILPYHSDIASGDSEAVLLSGFYTGYDYCSHGSYKSAMGYVEQEIPISLVIFNGDNQEYYTLDFVGEYNPGEFGMIFSREFNGIKRTLILREGTLAGGNFIVQEESSKVDSVSWNDLTDRPFGEENNSIVIEWDGNTEGLEVVTNENGGIYRVSGLTPSVEEFIGAIIVEHNGNPNELHLMEEYQITEDDIVYGDNAIAVNTGNICIAYKDGATLFDGSFVLPKAGLYFCNSGIHLPENHDGEVLFFVYSMTYGGGSSIKTLDEKFIPDTIARSASFHGLTVPEATGETVTAAEFNALLAALREAGYLAI